MDGRQSRAKMDGERELGAWHLEKPMDAGGSERRQAGLGKRVGLLLGKEVATCNYVSGKHG